MARNTMLHSPSTKTIPRHSGSTSIFQKILLAGATGNLGGHIARALIARGAHVRTLGRLSSDPARIIALQQLGV